MVCTRDQRTPRTRDGGSRAKTGRRERDRHTHTRAGRRRAPSHPAGTEASAKQPLVPALMLGVYLHPKGGQPRGARAQGNLIVTLRICRLGPRGQRQSLAGSNREQEINSNSSPFTLDKKLLPSPLHITAGGQTPGSCQGSVGPSPNGAERLARGAPGGHRCSLPLPPRLRFTGRVSINRNTRRKSPGRLLGAERCPESIQRPSGRPAPQGNAAGPGGAGRGGAESCSPRASTREGRVLTERAGRGRLAAGARPSRPGL